MLHLLLDTSVFRNDPARKKAEFRTITRLSSEGKLTLHVPYFVEREFVTQQQASYGDAINSLKQSLNALTKKLLPEELTSRLAAFEALVGGAGATLPMFARDEFLTWLRIINAERYSFDVADAQAVVEGYFEGTPPFRAIKARGDFPDAFIKQSAIRIASNVAELHLVTEDNRLRESFQEINNIRTHASLEAFLETPELIPILREFAYVDSYLKHIDAFRQPVVDAIESTLGDAISWTVVKDSRIRDDNEEAKVLYPSAPENIEVDWNATKYYGNGTFVFPFHATVFATLNYAIYKGTYYGLPDDEFDQISVTDLNEHYYDAEQTFKLLVDGVVSLSVPIDVDEAGLPSPESIDMLVESSDASIDSITDVVIADDW